ncbi:kinase-like protein [Aspergillus steynii IBT 23096]|uniref:Kinase-like protein n=1 Tax=Aspergillus steynii IBT 23096 TaxID=1392250 RepID=A0A2I2FYY5_9EURO|nr:kinase-like protein [Aspergillus steynii IBT 23096]PLB45852.1 kinase-like protein [Aspergillus steynii IBT 23096]
MAHKLHLKRLRPSTPKQRTSIRNTPKLKDEFSSSIKLGHGASGTVYLMYERHSQKPRAVKEVGKDSDETREDYATRVYKEFELASKLHHPNVVETLRLCSRSRRLCIVMEHCANGEVFDQVEGEHLTESEKLCLFKQLLHGVEYLHSQGVAHRDIKMENLLLNEAGHLKIADFGLSTTGNRAYGTSALTRCVTRCGTPHITPPEVMRKTGFYDGRAYDVWSCAMTLLIMLSPTIGQWETATPSDRFYAHYMKKWAPYNKSFWDTLPDWVSDAETRHFGPNFYAIPDRHLRRLLLKMLHPDPAKRLTISQALDHPFVRGIECCCRVPNSRDQCPPARHYHGPPARSPSPSPAPSPSPVRFPLNIRWNGWGRTREGENV